MCTPFYQLYVDCYLKEYREDNDKLIPSFIIIDKDNILCIEQIDMGQKILN